MNGMTLKLRNKKINPNLNMFRMNKHVNKVFQGGETTHDECNQDRHQNKQPRNMLSSQTHHQL